MVIYKTTNLINNKIYIGQDINNNPLYLDSGKIIKRAIKKFGINNFKKEILEYCKNQEELDLKKIYWIKTLNSTNKDIGYNICEGGRSYRTMRGENNSNFGKKWSIEERKRISELTKKDMTEKVKEHIRKMRKLQVFSEETKKKFSQCKKKNNYRSLKYFVQSPNGQILEFITEKKVMQFLDCDNYFFVCKKFKEYILLKTEKVYSKKSI